MRPRPRSARRLKPPVSGLDSGEAVVLRLPGAEDQGVPRTGIRQSGSSNRSFMPEGLIESLPDQDVIDLLAYLLELK